MAGQNGRPAPSAAEITYTNTIGDAVRMTLDQAYVLPPAQQDVSAVLTSVAATWMHEMQARQHMPQESFNFLAGPATCRMAAATVLTQLAESTMQREASFISLSAEGAVRPAAYTAASALFEETINRLVTNGGFRDSREGAAHERREFSFLTSRVAALLDQPTDKSIRARNRAQEEALRSGNPLAVHRLVLADAMSETVQWSVTQAFGLARRGENTAGRLLGALGVLMTPEHINLGEPAGSSHARRLREMQLVARVLGYELQQPGSVPSSRAQDAYADTMQRLREPPRVLPATEYTAALQPALAYAAKVETALGKEIQKCEGRFVQVPAGRFVMPASSQLQ